MPNDKRSKLSAEPDVFGFLYGWGERAGEHVRVDVLPTEHLWRGDIKLEGQKPDPKAWILYLDEGNSRASSAARTCLPCWASRACRGEDCLHGCALCYIEGSHDAVGAPQNLLIVELDGYT